MGGREREGTEEGQLSAQCQSSCVLGALECVHRENGNTQSDGERFIFTIENLLT